MNLHAQRAHGSATKRRTPAAGGHNARRQMACALLVVAALAVACRFNFGTHNSSGNGVPPQAQAVIDTLSKDLSEGRYDKIYDDAAEEWRKTATLEKTKEVLTFLKEKLGGVKTRNLQTVRDQDNSGGELPGHSLVVIYQTAFERAEGMETVTLIERNGRWLLASYYVSSSALKQ